MAADETAENQGPPPQLPPPPAKKRVRRVAPASEAAPVQDEAPQADPEPAPAPKPRAPRPAPVRAAQESRLAQDAADAADQVRDWRTPLGLLGLAIVSIALILLVVPVNGRETRFQLLWNAIINRVRLPGVVYPDNNGIGFVDPATAAAAQAATQNGQASNTPSSTAVAASAAAQGFVSGFTAGVGGGEPALSTGDLGGFGSEPIDELAPSTSNGYDPYAAFVD